MSYISRTWQRSGCKGVYVDRRRVVDELVKEQFVEVLPEEVKVWAKERKSNTSEEAGQLTEDYRQARKVEFVDSR